MSYEKKEGPQEKIRKYKKNLSEGRRNLERSLHKVVRCSEDPAGFPVCSRLFLLHLNDGLLCSLCAP